MLSLQDAKILLQNLLNRATDTAIQNAKAENRKVDTKEVEALVVEFKNIYGKFLKEFAEKNPKAVEDANKLKKPYNGFNKWKK